MDDTNQSSRRAVAVPANAITKNSLLLALANAWSELLTPAGRLFIIPTFIFAAIGSTSLDHHIYVACLYSLSFWIVSLPFSIFDSPNVKLNVTHSDRVSAGETVPVEINVEQTGRFPHADVTVVPHRLPAGIQCVPGPDAVVAPTKRGEVRSARLRLKCDRRGVYDLVGWRAETSFPFGLMHTYRVFKMPERLLVYPAFVPLVSLNIESGRRYHPGGFALASKLGESFEYLGNREYRDGDNIRDMDWRATSRLNKPIIREYREEYFHRVAVVLDTHVPTRSKAVHTADFERAVSMCASISDYMARQEYLVDLFAAGPDLYHLTAGRSLAYVDQILDILACVDSNPDEPFETLEPEIRGYLSQITTIVCVLLDWNETRREFVNQIMRDGATVSVIIARTGPCSVDPHSGGDQFPITVVDAARFNAGIDQL